MLKQYKINEDIIDEIQTHYSNILDEIGLNVSDPVASHIGFFNTTGRNSYEPMRLGKTAIFFTRPNLNFHSYSNISRSRTFSYFRGTQLGCSLMRLLMYPKIADEMYYGIYGEQSNKAPVLGICDDTNIGGEIVTAGERSIPILSTNFIPMFSNTCVDAEGGKDIILDVHETPGNFSGERLQYAKGIDESLTIGQLQITFEEMYHSPIMTIIFLWVMYMHYVVKSLCKPNYNYMIHRIIDYTCSIYIFMLGTDNMTILRWVKYTGCFPLSIPFSSILHSQELNQQVVRSLSTNWAYNFASPMDPTALAEFNMISGPSIYHRLKTYYDDKDAKLTNELIKYHVLSESNAVKLIEKYYPPYHEGDVTSESLPQKRINKANISADFASEYSLEHATGYEEMLNGEKYNPLLINRANGLIRNNFSGVPYIVNGNKLMYV
jgi:hypothetical protein